MSKHLNYLLVIFLFSLIGIKSLISPGLFTAHDIWHQVVRLYYYSEGINDGQFPPYWVGQLANGFGYPLFLFSYHLPWIFGIPFLKIGLGIAGTLKMLFILSYVGSGITMYFFVTNLLKNNLAGLLSALLYLWLPYHFLITFVSASLGIAFVFTFLPLLFLGILLLKEGSNVGIPIFATGLSGIILSHIMHLAFVFPTIIIFTIWAFKFSQIKFLFIKELLFGIILGILLSSFYLLPAAYYNQFTRVHKEEGMTKLYERNFINLKQLIYSRWGFSPIVNNAKNGEISFQLGIAQWISVISLLFLIFLKKLRKSYQILSITLIFSFSLNIFLMLDSSTLLWKFLVKFVALDFPFRFLLSSTFIASICAGILLVNFNRRIQISILIFLVTVALYTNRNHINVNEYTNFPILTYLNLETEITTNTFHEYLPINANPKLLGNPWNEVKGENISIYNLKRTTNLLSFNANITREGIFTFGQFFFPGQTLYLNNSKEKINTDKEGRIIFYIPQGTHSITVKYQETPLIKLSKTLTLIGFLTLFILFGPLKILKRKFYF